MSQYKQPGNLSKLKITQKSSVYHVQNRKSTNIKKVQNMCELFLVKTSSHLLIFNFSKKALLHTSFLIVKMFFS